MPLALGIASAIAVFIGIGGLARSGLGMTQRQHFASWDRRLVLIYLALLYLSTALGVAFTLWFWEYRDWSSWNYLLTVAISALVAHILHLYGQRFSGADAHMQHFFGYLLSMAVLLWGLFLM